MTTAEELARRESEAEEERRTTYLELFFDLVFVFAVTQVTALVAHDPTARGFGHGALVFGLVWWAWSGYAWMTNAIDVERTVVRTAVLGAAGASFFMAIALPHAFGDDGLRFALAYLVVRVIQLALYIWGLRHDPAHQAAILRLAPWFFVAPLVALAGGFADGDARVWLWIASLAIDVTGAATVGRAGFRISPAHFAERYALFVIIALGESIVAIGASAIELPRNGTFFATAAISFALACVLWWSYFDFPALAAARALRFASPERRGPLARDLFTLFHFPNVLGIIFVAVAAKKAVAHPSEPLSGGGRAALALGLSLFLLQFVLGRLRVIHRVSWERLVGMAAIVAVAAAGGSLDAVWVLAAALAVMVATTVAEDIRLGQARAIVRADGPPVPRAEALGPRLRRRASRESAR
jgi:low temperature requirement protein LtrA